MPSLSETTTTIFPVLPVAKKRGYAMRMLAIGSSPSMTNTL